MEAATTSTSLLEKVRRQHPQAWERLVNTYAPVIYSWCRRDGVRPDDAADIAQDILLTLFLKLDGFQREEPGATFRGWLRRITSNRIADHWRRVGRHPEVVAKDRAVAEQVPGGSATGPAESPDWRMLEVVQATERVRNRCSERTWEIFMHYFSDNFSAKETSEAFGVSVGYVHQVRARMLMRLRQELSHLGETSAGEP